MIKIVISVLAFQAAWAASAYGSVNAWPSLAVIACLFAVALNLVLYDGKKSLLALALLAGVYGFLAESAISLADLMSYRSPGPFAPLAPIWIVTLWMGFATLIRPAFGWLTGRLLLAGVLGAITGPVSYFAAAQIGALSLHNPQWMGLASISVMWAFGMPLLVELNKRLSASR